MSSIQVSNLCKSFGNFQAVSNISFEIGDNKVVGFLGPNGAGKTTTLRMLVGLSQPSSGEVKIADNQMIFGKSDVNKNFGYLPEAPSFYNWMTGQEYLGFIYDTFSLDYKKRSTRISELLTLVSLTESKNKRIGSYSNGMKQRLGIAQALVNDPPILILDEPVSALDPIGRRDVLNIINNLKKSKTILFSTHILSDVDKICDEIIVINHGKIIANTPIAELKEKNTGSILEIEFSSNPEKLIAKLKKEEWAQKLELTGHHLKIWVKDESIINNNVPLKYFAKQDIGILKYGLVLPEIEDLFIEMLAK
jgi:ABC-2 type transport system ATP-binding protein